MRHNDEIRWKDQVAIEAMKILLKDDLDTSLETNSPAHPAPRERLANCAYLIAEAMFKERERNEHNPTNAS